MWVFFTWSAPGPGFCTGLSVSSTASILALSSRTASVCVFVCVCVCVCVRVCVVYVCMHKFIYMHTAFCTGLSVSRTASVLALSYCTASA